MKKLCCLIALTLTTLIAVPAVVPTALAQAAAPAGHKEFVEYVFGPFRSEHRACEEAEEWRERGFHTKVFRVCEHDWQLRVWRHE